MAVARACSERPHRQEEIEGFSMSSLWIAWRVIGR